MRAFVGFLVVFIVYLESVSPGAGADLIGLGLYAMNGVAHSLPAGLVIALVLLLPAYLLGADHKAKAMLDEDQKKLDERKAKWRVF